MKLLYNKAWCHHKYISVQKSYTIIIHSQLLDERWSFLLSFKYYLKLDTLPYNVDNWMTFHFIVLLSNYLRTFKIEPFYHRVKTFNHCRFTKFISITSNCCVVSCIWLTTFEEDSKRIIHLKQHTFCLVLSSYAMYMYMVFNNIQNNIHFPLHF